MEQEMTARERAELIIRVRSGSVSATAAARRLGVSRKTYYKWEQRALHGMVAALSERPGGRPAQERNEEQERLQERIRVLEEQLQRQEQARRVNEVLNEAGEKKD